MITRTSWNRNTWSFCKERDREKETVKLFFLHSIKCFYVHLCSFIYTYTQNIFSYVTLWIFKEGTVKGMDKRVRGIRLQKSTDESSVVLQFSVAAEGPGAVNQFVPLSVLRVQQTVFVVLTLRLTRPPVDVRHHALHHQHLWSNQTKSNPIQTHFKASDLF